MISIRRRLLWSLLLTLLAALSFNSLLAHFVARHEVDEVFDAELLSTARIIKGLLNQKSLIEDAGRIGQALEETLRDNEEMPSELQSYEKKILLQVWDHHGDDMLFRSSQAPDFALAPLRQGFYYHEQAGSEWIVYVTALHEADAWLLVGEIPTARDELSQSLVAVFIASGVLALIIASILAISSINFGLAPLARLRQLLKHRDANNLAPLELPGQTRELAAVVNSINLLFIKIEDGLAREKRFVADAAHELRTPLAVMKLRTQTLLDQPHDDNTRQELKALEASVSRSHRVVEQLLMLASLDQNQRPTEELEPQDICEQIRLTLAEVWPEAARKHIELVVCGTEQVTEWVFHPVLLDVALRNLVENAIRYSPAHSEITVTLISDDHTIRITVEDQGPGVRADALSQLHERFFRLAGQEVPGSGLGLSIVQRVCTHMGAELLLENREEGGFRAALVFRQP